MDTDPEPSAAAPTPREPLPADEGDAPPAPVAALPHERRRRGRGPWVASAVAALVLSVVLLSVATGGFTTFPFRWATDTPGAPGGGTGGGGGAGGGGDGDDGFNITILGAETAWSLPGGGYQAVWFMAPDFAAVWGGLRATGSTEYFLVNASTFQSWAGGNRSVGASGSLSGLAADANWSEASPASVTLTEEVLGPGAYELVAANTGTEPTVEMTVWSTIYETDFDTS